MTPLAAYLLLFTIVGIGFIFIHLVAGKLIRPSKPDPEKGTIYECGEPTIGSAWVQFDLRFYVVALLFVIFDVEVAFFFPWAEVFGKANAVATAPKPETAEEYVEYAKKVQDAGLPASSSDTGASPASRSAAKRYEAITGRRADGSRILDEDGEPKKPLTDDTLQEIQKEQQAVKEKMIAGGGKAKLSRAEEDATGMDGPLKASDFKENRAAASSLAWLAPVEVLVFFGLLLVGFAYLWRRGDLDWVRSTAAQEAGPPEPAIPSTG